MKLTTLHNQKTFLFTILFNLDTLIDKHQICKGSLSKANWEKEKKNLLLLTGYRDTLKELYNKL
jgi:hypothetical protein|tara:strand:+ start:338 stop:529 length:192 start_codon:yes stop_codon:yes gene_type:complete